MDSHKATARAIHLFSVVFQSLLGWLLMLWICVQHIHWRARTWHELLGSTNEIGRLRYGPKGTLKYLTILRKTKIYPREHNSDVRSLHGFGRANTFCFQNWLEGRCLWSLSDHLSGGATILWSSWRLFHSRECSYDELIYEYQLDPYG